MPTDKTNILFLGFHAFAVIGLETLTLLCKIDTMKAKPITALQARVTGRVQGVAFRYYAQGEAERLGVTGWIRNNDDGSVEVWAEGIEEKVIHFLDWLHKGPPHARVDNVRSDLCQPQKTYKNFSITG